MEHCFSQRRCERSLGDGKMEKKVARSIIPRDDGFHGNRRHIAAEWWYFDAVFKDGYSVHLGVRTFSKKGRGFVKPMIEIYKDFELVKVLSSRFRMKHCDLLSEYASVKIDGKEVILFDKNYFDKTGKWRYKVCLEIEDYVVDLVFESLSSGWKIETSRESWTVALPKASVSGKIVVDGKKLEECGVGYHDHNWNYTIKTAWDYGRAWYWGKVKSKSFNVVWANIVKSKSESEYHAIVNTGDGRFFDVHADKMSFTEEGSMVYEKKQTPKLFRIAIDDELDGVPIKAKLCCEVVGVHLDKVLGSPYWRYHVKTSGFLSVDGKTEPIDGLEIMEFLRFRKIK